MGTDTIYYFRQFSVLNIEQISKLTFECLRNQGLFVCCTLQHETGSASELRLANEVRSHANQNILDLTKNN